MRFSFAPLLRALPFLFAALAVAAFFVAGLHGLPFGAAIGLSLVAGALFAAVMFASWRYRRDGFRDGFGRRGAVMAVALAVMCAGLFAIGGVARAQVNTLNYMEQGGAAWDVGGALKFASGGYATLDKATASATSGNSYAVTSNHQAVIVTTDSLTTAAGSSRAITITDSQITASSGIQVSWIGGTNTGGTPIIKAVPGSGSVTVTLYNNHASAAFNGTFVVSVLAY